jgi:hypothetical protein
MSLTDYQAKLFNIHPFSHFSHVENLPKSQSQLFYYYSEILLLATYFITILDILNGRAKFLCKIIP